MALSAILRRNPGHLLLASITGGKREMPLQPALSMFGYLTEAIGERKGLSLDSVPLIK